MARVKRAKRELLNIEMTSLLDIITILIFFLLINMKEGGIEFNLAQEIVLPWSETNAFGEMAVIVQVSPSSIWVDDQAIVKNVSDIIQSANQSLFDPSGKIILPLYNELLKKRETASQLNDLAPNRPKIKPMINLVIDKSIKYDFVKKVMNTCAKAGYREFNFVVQSKRY